MIKKISFVNIGGFPTARLSRPDIADLLVSEKSATDGLGAKLFFDINGHGLALAYFDEKFRADLRAAEIIHADGQPMVVASRWLTKSAIPERSATTDVFHDVAAMAQTNGKTFFLLGATDDVVKDCARLMKEKYPALKIAGYRNGYFSEAEEQSVCDEINASGADIVWVGLGKPKEQAFCVRNRNRIHANWLVTCGGCFNYVTGSYPRAPQWMQESGLEWVHRLLTRPRQLAWRYLSTTPIALYLLLTRTSEHREASNASV